jgi:hypothetical protein
MNKSVTKNGKLDISPELNTRFRKLVERRYGGWKKGILKTGAEEAITEWCEKVEKKLGE